MPPYQFCLREEVGCTASLSLCSLSAQAWSIPPTLQNRKEVGREIPSIHWFSNGRFGWAEYLHSYIVLICYMIPFKCIPLLSREMKSIDMFAFKVEDFREFWQIFQMTCCPCLFVGKKTETLNQIILFYLLGRQDNHAQTRGFRKTYLF